MSEGNLTFEGVSLTDYDDVQARPIDGVYEGRITEVDFKESKRGGQNLVVTFEVVKPESMLDKPLPLNYLSVPDENLFLLANGKPDKKTLKMLGINLRRFCLTFGVALDKQGVPVDFNAAIGNSAFLVVATKEQDDGKRFANIVEMIPLEVMDENFSEDAVERNIELRERYELPEILI